MGCDGPADLRSVGLPGLRAATVHMTTPRARQQAAIVSASGRVGATRGRAWARGGGGAIAGYGSVEAALHETLGPIGPNLQLPVMAAAAGPASQRVTYRNSSPMPWRSSPQPPSPQPPSTSPSTPSPRSLSRKPVARRGTCLRLRPGNRSLGGPGLRGLEDLWCAGVPCYGHRPQTGAEVALVSSGVVI